MIQISRPTVYSKPTKFLFFNGQVKHNLYIAAAEKIGAYKTFIVFTKTRLSSSKFVCE